MKQEKEAKGALIDGTVIDSVLLSNSDNQELADARSVGARASSGHCSCPAGSLPASSLRRRPREPCATEGKASLAVPAKSGADGSRLHGLASSGDAPTSVVETPPQA